MSSGLMLLALQLETIHVSTFLHDPRDTCSTFRLVVEAGALAAVPFLYWVSMCPPFFLWWLSYSVIHIYIYSSDDQMRLLMMFPKARRGKSPMKDKHTF